MNIAKKKTTTTKGYKCVYYYKRLMRSLYILISPKFYKSYTVAQLWCFVTLNRAPILNSIETPNRYQLIKFHSLFLTWTVFFHIILGLKCFFWKKQLRNKENKLAERHPANSTHRHTQHTYVSADRKSYYSVANTHIILAKRVFRAWLLWHFIVTISTLTEFAIFFFCRRRCSFLSFSAMKLICIKSKLCKISEYKVVQCFGSASMKTFCSYGLTEIINNQNGSINDFYAQFFAWTILSS